MARTRNNEKDLNEILSDMENIDEPDTVDVPLFQEAKFETPFVSAPVEQPKQNYASKLTPADEEMIVIGSSTTISSDINCSGNVEIRGQLLGNLIVSGVVTVSGSVEGNVEASEVTLLNEGKVNGNITCQNDLMVSEKCRITGNAKARNADIKAPVLGNLEIAHALRVGSTASINGDIVAETLAVESGAIINGHLTIKR